MFTVMILELLKQLPSIIKKYKLTIILVITFWLVSVVIIGIIIGMVGRPKPKVINPADINAKIVEDIDKLNDEYTRGLLMSPKDNLSIFEVELSRNYFDKKQKLEMEKTND